MVVDELELLQHFKKDCEKAEKENNKYDMIEFRFLIKYWCVLLFIGF
jgi:hypothetical protein